MARLAALSLCFRLFLAYSAEIACADALCIEMCGRTLQLTPGWVKTVAQPVTN